MSKNKVDVVIVGAGFAGLAAADAIAQYNAGTRGPNEPEVSFVVLEASDRAGGRTRTIVQDRRGGMQYLDVGGQYLGTSQSYMQALVERFNISTFPTCVPPDKLSVYQAPDVAGLPTAQLTYFSGNYPLTFNVARAIRLIESRTQIVKAALSEPWNSMQAATLDNQTVEAWATACLGPDPYAKELTQLAIRCAFSVEWSELSALYLLFYGATAGSFEAFENVTGGEGGDRIRFTYGTKSLVDALVNSLRSVNKASIRLRSRVKCIEQLDGGDVAVTVETGNRSRVIEARQVIVAMSPGASHKIEYRPKLPTDRLKFAQNMVMGRTIKGFLLYDKPWWRSKYTGYVLSAKGPACWIMDNTWQDPDTGVLGPPSLMTFVAGKFADESFAGLSKRERQLQLEQQVNEIFQDDNAHPATEYIESDWHTAPEGGCPAAVPRLGAMVECASAIRKPHGAIHWAGSETGLEWTGGYMNGAVQSGVRAAGEAINALLLSAARVVHAPRTPPNTTLGRRRSRPPEKSAAE